MTDGVLSFGLVVGLAVWLAISITLGIWLGYIRHSHIWGFVLAIFIFVAPIWDLPFGLWRFHKAVSEFAGTRVFRQVHADGYLNLVRTSSFSSLGISAHIAYLRPPLNLLSGENRNVPYLYKDSKIVTTDGGPLVPRPGTWRFRLAASSDPECAAFQAWSVATGFRLSDELAGTCVVASEVLQPQSQYVLEPIGESSPQPLPGPKLLPPVLIRGSRVVDSHSGEVVAQSYQVSYQSWLPMPEIDDARPLSWKSAFAAPFDIRLVVLPD